MSAFLRRHWRRLPISIPRKQRIRSALFRAFPYLFRRHPAFAAWTEDRQAARDPFGQADLGWMASVPLTDAPPPSDPPARILAFYLPQYHPTPENDAWWGAGFTEWRNVIRGRPQFPGHYQPRLPGELGFYDLRVPEVQARQIELARLYGIAGFVFYFYWFDGRRLLERPLLQYLADPTLDLPFCLCWANESWSRRWDGRERDILIAQSHSPGDDLDFIAYVATYLRDPRYIRIGDRPLLLVYRPDLMPDPQQTAERWRSWCRDEGIGEIYLAYTQSFETRDPAAYGFDAAVEFPPNNTAPREITREVKDLNPHFKGIIYDWRIYPQRSRSYRDPGYRLFRGVNPSWDNEARRPGRGAIFYGASPAGYREWLENAIKDTLARFSEPEERLVFVNAWNEWAEGAHLEPDQRNGYAYLQATRDALAAVRVGWRRSILVVSHDARLHGAQLLALSLVRELAQGLGYRVHVLALGPGPLLPEFVRFAEVEQVDLDSSGAGWLDDYLARIKGLGIREAIVNTTASAPCVPGLQGAGIRVIALVHELPDLIRAHGLGRQARLLAERADYLVFPAQSVREAFARFGPVEDERAVIRPQGLFKRNRFKPSQREQARQDLARRLGLEPDAQVVLAVGFGDHRKGFDLFVAAGLRVCRVNPRVHLVWVGAIDPSLEAEALRRIDDAGLLGRFVFTGHAADTDPFYAGADLYALTSREDPFPSVVLEALDAGLPVVGFKGAGGFAALEGTGCLELVPAFDTEAYAGALAALLADEPRRARIAGDARAVVRRELGFRRYLLDLMALSRDAPPKISVIVPSYNYRRYLPERIRSIASQTVPVYELIVLDDASTDGSREWLEAELEGLFPDAKLYVNASNSGSPFRQWQRGVDLARGDFVWIAEADDLAEPELLAGVMSGFSDPKVVLSYAQSAQIDEGGRILAEDYQGYLEDISPSKWRQPYVAEGEDEIRTCLAIKNTIPNVSAVVFRREVLGEVLRSALDRIMAYRVAGDWITYVEVLRRGRIAYCPKSLNRHRRHEAGVTISGYGRDQLEEILRVQALIRRELAPDPATDAKARAYASRLYAQFGLAAARAPTIRDDPALAPLLGPPV